MKLLRDNIFVELIEEEESPIISINKDKNYNVAIVQELGPWVDEHIQIGDKIYFPKFHGKKIMIGNKEKILIQEDDVMIVFPKEENNG